MTQSDTFAASENRSNPHGLAPSRLGCGGSWTAWAEASGHGFTALAPRARPPQIQPGMQLKRSVLLFKTTRSPAKCSAAKRGGSEVRHPHLIAILDAQLVTAPFLVMPWLEGSSLAEYAIAGPLLDPPVVLWIARQTAERVDALDRAGWQHGDIKPGNIFISPQDTSRSWTWASPGIATSADDRA